MGAPKAAKQAQIDNTPTPTPAKEKRKSGGFFGTDPNANYSGAALNSVSTGRRATFLGG